MIGGEFTCGLPPSLGIIRTVSIELPLHLEARRRKERPAFALASRALRDALVAGSAQPVAAVLGEATLERPEVSPGDVLFAGHIHGVSGLLARLPGVPEPLCEGLRADVEGLTARAARVREDLARLGERAAARGLPFVPLKGGVLAFERYPAPELRPTADIDLLAPPGSFEGWAELLNEERYALQTRGRNDSVFARPGARTPVDFREHPDNPCPVELHRRLETRLLGRSIDLTERYLADLREARVVGQPARVPSDRLLFLHLLVHAGPVLVGRGARLIQLHDLGVVRPGAADAPLAVELLGEAAWGLASLAARGYPGTLPGSFLEALPSPPADRLRRWLAPPGLLDGSRERTLLVLSELGLCASLGDRLARIADALPETSFLARAYGRGGPGALARYYRDRITR